VTSVSGCKFFRRVIVNFF